jgi:hypothetical protein
MTRTLPNFLVIGAARSGTTSLQHYLGSHPEIYMSPLKEPNFFAYDGERFDFHALAPGWSELARLSVTSWRDYRELFHGVTEENAIGEISPSYMRSPGAAARIQRTLPEVRLVAVLRNPADRAYANYLGRLRDGTEQNGDANEAIGGALRGQGPSWRREIYLELGRYHARLQPFFEHFDRERIRIYLFEDFARDPAIVLRDLFAFLGVDPTFVPDTSRRHNRTGRIDNPVLRFAWTRSRSLRLRVGPRVPESWRRALWSLIGRNLSRPALAPDLRTALVEYYRPDVLELEALLERDLSAWRSTETPAAPRLRDP